MPPFTFKAHTAETYLAGIGATGALIASAFVAFMLLVGAVTFDSWPRPSGLLGGDNGEVSLTVPAPAAEPAPTQVPNLGQILGRREARDRAALATVSRAPSGPSRTPGTTGVLRGGTVPAPGGPTDAQPPATAPGPPPDAGQPSSLIRGAGSAVGNTVEGTTNTVGNSLGGHSSPGLGGVVGGLGRSVNSTVQGLVGGK